MVVELPARWRELAVRVGAALGLRHFRVTLRGAAMDEVPDQARVVSVAPSSGVGALLILGQETAAELAARTMLKAAFAEFGVELRAD